jgi:hypothetical protein
LELQPGYKQLKASLKPDDPVVFVFGGGGPLWLDLYKRLRDNAASGEERSFALLLPDVEQGTGGRLRRKICFSEEELKKRWQALTGSAATEIMRAGDWKEKLIEILTANGVNDATKEVDDWARKQPYSYSLHQRDGQVQPLRDPGKLGFWYALCALVVGRGGLVAQQVMATMMANQLHAPQMLFIEEPGHPQIEHQRLSLYNLGFVHSRRWVDFKNNPLQVIDSVMREVSSRPRPIRRVAARYGKGMMQELGEYIISLL